MLGTATYQVKMENFEGPLDLLCHLIEKNKMDIFDIKIAEITNQYLDYLQMMQEINLEVTSEFIIMASKLIYLKSKTLLPNMKEDEEEEIDLVQLLIEYKKYKETTGGFKERLEEYGKKFYRLPEKIELPKEKLDAEFDSAVIPDLYSALVRKEIEKKNINAYNVQKLAVTEKVTILSKVREILKQLWNKPSFIFNKIFNTKKQTRTEVVTAFLSLLELSKMNRVTIKQNSLFGDIDVVSVKRDKKKNRNEVQQAEET